MERKYNYDLPYLIENFTTPMYVYDMVELKNRVNFLKKNIGEDIALCYAMKANSFITADIEPWIEKFEVCSPGELHICKNLSIAPEKIVVSGVYKDKATIEFAFKDFRDVKKYTVESVAQFDLLKEMAEKYEHHIEILLRLTSGHQFGINAEEIMKIIRDYRQHEYLCITGIQYFTGTQKRSVKRLAKEVDTVDRLITEIYEKFGFKIKEMEFGTGFPVFYFGEHQENKKGKEQFEGEEAFLKEFGDILKNMRNKVEVTLEVGRSIAASCGTYITEIVDMKNNMGQNYALVDGGIHQIVYYGQFMATKLPEVEIFRKVKGHTEKCQGEKLWNICGALCTINDILIKQMPSDRLEIGDSLVFRNAGAYCATEGMSTFLCRDLPEIIIYREENGSEEYEIVRERFETYRLNQPKLKDRK